MIAHPSLARFFRPVLQGRGSQNTLDTIYTHNEK
jgi:hypothetical protein